MRALIVLFALVATPFVAGVSQVGGKCDNGKSDGHRSAQGTASAHKGVCQPQVTVLDADHDGVPDGLDTCPGTPLGTAVDASGCPVQSAPPPVLDADGDGVPDSLDQCPGTPVGTTVDASGCPVQSTPPPPPPTSGGACVNSGSAGGTASIDGQVFVDASPWPGLQGWCVQANGPVSVTAVTDASGNYLFPGLPAGTYTVCETVQTGWHQTFPTSGPSCPNGFGWTLSVKDGEGQGFIWFGNLTP